MICRNQSQKSEIPTENGSYYYETVRHCDLHIELMLNNSHALICENESHQRNDTDIPFGTNSCKDQSWTTECLQLTEDVQSDSLTKD